MSKSSLREAWERARKVQDDGDARRHREAIDTWDSVNDVEEYVGKLRDISYCPPDYTLERWIRILADHWYKTMGDPPVGETR